MDLKKNMAWIPLGCCESIARASLGPTCDRRDEPRGKKIVHEDPMVSEGKPNLGTQSQSILITETCCRMDIVDIVFCAYSQHSVEAEIGSFFELSFISQKSYLQVIRCSR